MDWGVGRKLARPCGVEPGALGLRAAFRHSRGRGRSVTPPELSVGGMKDTRWTRDCGTELTGPSGISLERWNFGPRSVVQWEGNAPSPPPELSVGGTRDTRWTGEWDGNSLGF